MTDPQMQWIGETAREFLVEGSAGSGKTIFACYKVVFYALQYHHASIYVYRRTLPSLKRTAWKEIRNILYGIVLEKDQYGRITKTLYDVCHENKSEGTIEFPNDSIIYFGALDEIGKVRSINADIIYIEQGEELLDTAFYTELMLRLGRGEVSKRGDAYSQMMMVVQPEDEEHWIYQRFHEYYDATNEYENEKALVLSHNQHYPDNLWDYRDYNTVLKEIQTRRVTSHFHYTTNDFLPQFQKDYYDNLKNEDYELWLRYSAGKWGKLTDVIYPNYDTNVGREHFDFYSFGIDYGYNNPSCFLLLGWYDTECYVLDEVYERKLTTSELIEKCVDMLHENKLLVEHLHTGFGDSAEPDRNEEFYNAGFPIEPSVKNVSAKINTTKQTKLHIDPRCINTIKEIKGYVYKKDKNGTVTDEPVKVKDHAMDALGYGVYGVRGALSPNRPEPPEFYEENIMVF